MAADNALQKFSIKLPSSLSAYHDFVQKILENLQLLNWENQVLFGVHMALEESITNAIRHGNKEDTEKMVLVDCEIDAQRFWAKICDEGEGYDPDRVPDCCSDENLDEPGGRGLTLIRAYMDSVELSDNGCCMTMELLRKAE